MLDEGLGGFTPSLSGLGFVADRYQRANSALAIGLSGSVTVNGLSALLPAPGAPATVSATVKCSLPATSNATMAAVAWAPPPGPAETGARLALSLTGVNNAATMTGSISTVVPVAAGLNTPRQGVFDRWGNYYVLSFNNYRIGVANKSLGYAFSWIVGSGVSGRADGVGTSATMIYASGIAISEDGLTLYWSDYLYGGVRQVDLRTMQTSYVVNSESGAAGYREGVGTNAQPHNLSEVRLSGIKIHAFQAGQNSAWILELGLKLRAIDGQIGHSRRCWIGMKQPILGEVSHAR
jgi:hypothetical protein